ncbi:DUF7002 family protein [Roseisolibacter agri]|uniref:Uncharacterized protein n=1 Tax=Roseisolibacter agri TaxID=2014610 RepID=A0AA37Q8M7_9BACT|nr:hypothetical protein [Roseisolibacter agri]GLC28299.1 hypothetical protein rosag_48120 [Roseisolibacter agri]
MPFDLTTFGRLRPYLYHLTAAENLPRIRRTRVLESAAALARRAGRAELLRERRRDHVPVLVDGEPVVLRDQAPLHRGNMALDDGWTFAEFVEHLNARVFFWPGTAQGPIAYGQRHFGRYEAEHPAILRVPFAALVAANPGWDVRFCRFNSGSPRWTMGRAAPRGAATFVPADGAAFGAAQVVEVTVCDQVVLPDETAVGERLAGPWRPLA